MGRTLAEKVWDEHVVRSAAGEPDLLYIDLHLLHEVTSPQAFDGLRLAGRSVRRPDLTLAGVLLGFVAGVLVIMGELRKAAEEVVAVTYWFDAVGIRWQDASMEGRTSWADVWLVQGERCLVIVKGRSLR